MEKQKRYIVTFESYIFAKNDKEALKQSKAMVSALKKFDDNQADVIGLFEQPFGTLEKRDINLKG